MKKRLRNPKVRWVLLLFKQGLGGEPHGSIFEGTWLLYPLKSMKIPNRVYNGS